jgi:uncharacterized membrane protein YeaQ/YmgE (transglycosylase-associated protein family)
MEFIYIIIIGLIAGWLAGLLFRGRGYGVGVDLVVGVLGAFLGWWIFSSLGAAPVGLVEQLGTALLGALVLLMRIKLIPRQGNRL